MNEINIAEFVTWLKEASPIVWHAVMKQQRIVIWMWTIGFFVSLCFVITFIILAGTKHDDIWDIFCVVFGGLFLVCLIGMLVEVLPRLLNIEYYAIMELKP